MSDELIERLRGTRWPEGVKQEAADHIEALTAENERLQQNAKDNNALARMYKAQADEFRAKWAALAGDTQ